MATRHPRAQPRLRSPGGAAGLAAGSPPTETQRRVLDAALGLFAERGFDGVTTAQIAAHAGVAEKTLFANFGSKERLYQATLGPAGLRAVFVPEAARTLLQALDQAPVDLRDLLRRIFQDRVRFARAHPREVKLLAQHLLLNPDGIRVITTQINQRLGPAVYPILDRLIEGGALRGDLRHPTLLRMIAAQAIAYVLARVLFRPDLPWDDEAETEAMVTVMADGLAPRGRQPVRTPPARPRRRHR